ncbi:MAG: hypothetical protein EBU04_01275 [Verrucomicrobia bacterium]|nr:hypothetical protein [Verrucomicrobiota bacterium]
MNNPMSLTESSSETKGERLNPFYRPVVEFSGLVRREFLGLMAATFGWTLLSSPLSAQEKKGKGGKGGKGGGDDSSKARGPSFQGEYVLPESLAEFAKVSLIFGRATDKAITASLVPKEATEAFLEIGTAKGKYVKKTAVTLLAAGKATEIVIDGLAPNTEYFYRLNHRKPGAGSFTQRTEARFATQRTPGSSFVFTIQGDSHPERPQSSHPDLYARTLVTAAADKPDFHICIGDDLQRPFLGLVGSVGQVFLMNGNHEQGSLFNFSQKDERRDVAIGVQKARNSLYPTPGNEGIYTGPVEPFKDIGPLKSYTSWTWGDALFVLLDNYWHSPALVDSGFGGKGGKGEKGGDDKKNRDWWGITIGDAQYKWLKHTLETSKAKHKFVFAHHVLGSGRGGVDEADLYEWGGQGKKGEGTFKEKRPGWELPIHQLMVKHKVSVFFQGHDHLYCQQEKDGIIYQELPMPSDHGYIAYNEDRYASGKKLPSAGYMRVSVTLPKDETSATKHGMIAHAYEVKARTA